MARWRWLSPLLWLCLVVLSTVIPADAADASDPLEDGRIAYSDAYGVSGGVSEIWTMTPDGSQLDQVTTDAGEAIREILIEPPDLWFTVRTASFTPRWLRDGTKLVHLHRGSDDRSVVRISNPDGTGLQQLFDDWQGSTPSWSPDGSKMTFGDATGVWVADGNGASRKRIADVSTGQWPFLPGFPSIVVDALWSPSGDKIAFVESSSVGHVAGRGWLSVVNADGSNRVEEICDSWTPLKIDWSPDGSQLVCSGAELRAGGVEVGGGIAIVAPDGTAAEGVVDSGENALWTMDGNGLLLFRSPEHEAPEQLWHYDLESGIEHLVATGFQGRDFVLQPRRGSFWDDESSVFWADIEWLADSGVTKGCNPPWNDKYCPDSFVTRGQMAAFLVRALGLTASLGDAFSDDDGHTFEVDIGKLAAAGITKGCNPLEGNTRFCPDRFVTRGQMAAFLVRGLGLSDRLVDPFSDDDGSMFEADIERLAAAGVTKGCNPSEGNTRFCPDGYVTRGQMAAFLHRALR